MKFLIALTFIFNSSTVFGAKYKSLEFNKKQFITVGKKPFSDLPLTYNKKVQTWVHKFQHRYKVGFKIWLERSYRYLPQMRKLLRRKRLPEDLAYISMIESGFSAGATSHAQAAGYWQFIKSTGKRYGLRKAWWLDERRDFSKSTIAASNYFSDLYKMFDSWYLTASAYNMGENRLKRLIKKHKTRNFWELSKKRDFPKETRDYIPKLIAAIIISKAPHKYGFKNLFKHRPLMYDSFYAPGGTDLHNLADKLGFTSKYLKSLNPGLSKGFIPQFIAGYWIRVPKGHLPNVARALGAEFH